MAKKKRRARTKASVRADLEAWCAEHGPLHATTLKQTDESLLTAMHRRFGSIKETAEELGLPFRFSVTSPSKEGIKEAIRDRRARGEPVSSAAVRREDRNLHYLGMSRFGSWEAALVASGLDAGLAHLPKAHSHESLGKDLRRWVERNGPLNATVLRKSDSRLNTAVQRFYGSVKDGAKAHGLPYEAKNKRWSPARVLAGIRKRAEEGKSLRSIDVRNDDRKLNNAGIRYFGGWRQAVESSGRSYEKIGRRPAWTAESIKAELKLACRAIGPLSSIKLRQYDAGLCRAAIRHYGSVGAAARQALVPFCGQWR